MVEKIVEDVVVEEVSGTVEDTVKEQAEQATVDAVADAASGSGNVAGMIVAGAMTVFAGIGAFCTGKFIKNKVKGAIDKHKAKKAAKLEAAQAPQIQQMATPVQTAPEAPKEGEYLTVADVMAQQEQEEEVEKPTPKKKK